MTISASTVAAILNACGLYSCEFIANKPSGNLYYKTKDSVTKVIDPETWLLEAIPDIRESVKIARCE